MSFFGVAGSSSFVSGYSEQDRVQVGLLRPQSWCEHIVHERFFALSFDDNLDADHGSLRVSVRNEVWRVFRPRSAAEEVFLPELAKRVFREPFREGGSIETLEGGLSVVSFDDDHVFRGELAEEWRRLR